MSDEIPRFSMATWIILNLLAEKGDLYGLELVSESGGRLKRGTVYVTLSRMADKGMVESYEVDPEPGELGPTRRKFKILGYGRSVRDSWAAEHFTGGLKWA